MSSVAERLDHYSMPEPNSGCRLWLGAVGRKGYGQLRVDYVLHWAHRLAWAEKNGPIPRGLLILHKCDVPACINPDHLRCGTAADNTADMIKKGRQKFDGLALSRFAVGNRTRRNQSRLTEEQVQAIRADGRISKDIAEDYGISAAYVRDIKVGRAPNRTRASR